MTDSRTINRTLKESMAFDILQIKDKQEIASFFIEFIAYKAVFTYPRARKYSSFKCITFQ